MAHGQRQVRKCALEVGWRDEPTLKGALNAVQVEVLEIASGRAIPGLTKSKRGLVSFGWAQIFGPSLAATPPTDPWNLDGRDLPRRTATARCNLLPQVRRPAHRSLCRAYLTHPSGRRVR